MKRTPAPDLPSYPIARENASLLQDFARSLAARRAHTQSAYVRDAWVLAASAGESALRSLTAREVRRFLAVLHGRGLSGRSLARMLSSWRAFFRYFQGGDP